MSYTAQNIVRMHDTDMAGIIYFASQFRFAHDAWEDMMAHVGLKFDDLFKRETFAFVIVHAEADFMAPLHVGDPLTIEIVVSKIGNTSFVLDYEIFREKQLVGTVKTVHVAIDRASGKKISVPSQLREKLEKYASCRS